MGLTERLDVASVALRERDPTRRAMTETERARFRQWWLEESGLSLGELREIRAGLVR